MFMLDVKDYGWWYWLASAVCLWTTMTVNPEAYTWALAIAITQLIHFRIVKGSFANFSVQIRLGYLSYLVLCMPEGLFWLLWVPAFGSLARVIFGYCLMGRILMLLPINRTEFLSWRYVKKAFFTPPVPGSLIDGLPQPKVA